MIFAAPAAIAKFQVSSSSSLWRLVSVLAPQKGSATERGDGTRMAKQLYTFPPRSSRVLKYIRPLIARR